MFRHTLRKLGEAPNFCPGHQAVLQNKQVIFFDKTIDITSLRWLSKTTTDITENIWSLQHFFRLKVTNMLRP